MGYLIVPYNSGYGSNFKHLPSVGEVESNVRMDLSGKKGQKENDPPSATGEPSPGNRRGLVNSWVVFYGAAFFCQHLFE
jgi:hypothetical protein